ncbi:Diacylglycerol O-acyltransferase 1 [Halotydeus destructor]|nr:Diacylglycerol O-acyltransferase 1 [Halotydeus destructor]
MADHNDNHSDNEGKRQSTNHKNGRLKSRRTVSVGRAVDIQGKEKRERAEQPDHPVHEPKDSLLSSSSGYTNYRGIFNLLSILLVLSNARVALENVIKYGILVDPVKWFGTLLDPAIWPSVQIYLGLNAFILTSYWIEKYLLLTGVLGEVPGRFVIGGNCALTVVIPAVVVYSMDVHPVGSSIALGMTSQVFLKLVSYHMVNYWCRKELRKSYLNMPMNGQDLKPSLRRIRSQSYTSVAHADDNLLDYINANKDVLISQSLYNDKDGKVYYPQNLNLKDIYYFIFAPTLCYELNFPRSQRIRKRFLIRRGIEMVFLIGLILALVQQWVVPTINNSTRPLQDMNYARMVERLLKLAVPNHIIWLIFFYWFFHSTANFIGEVMKFADREFYRDWWNAHSVPYFWSNWNIPVHKWCLRHLYKPLLIHGWSKFHASVAVFFVSAFFHEYLVSVPLKMFRIWAFSGMLFQIPFAMIVSRFHNYPQWANIAVWLSLILGQPLCILMYYHDYYVSRQTV